MINPSNSSSSSDKCASSSSDVSVDSYLYNRHVISGDFHEECTSPEYMCHNANIPLKNSHLEVDVIRNVEISGTMEDGGEKQSWKNFCHDEMERLVWDLPEAEDLEDDIENNAGLNKEDDYEVSNSIKVKEEKQKAFDRVRNGKFITIVRKLLNISCNSSLVKDMESWIEIVTRISWDAASFLRLDALNEKRMDVDSHVKVKCIASGRCSDSEVVKGLVFKKHAAHKHMPTHYNNPKLMLIRGVLGQSSSGLSSFKSIEQEKGNLKPLIDMIEMCHPNVILVEKSVSRDIQESILARGMTLVYDMKLHRLERVAQCIGSPILSLDALECHMLKHCKSFRVEKFVEEYSGLCEVGKKPSKTLMFIEDCPTRLGCTILLKGRPCSELKRVKYVVQNVVGTAYYLILESSFLFDQEAMLSPVMLPPNNKRCSVLGTSDIDIPVTGSENTQNLFMVPYVPCHPIFLSGLLRLSNSLKKVLGSNFSVYSSAPYMCLSNYFGFHARESNEELRHLSGLKITGNPDKDRLSNDEQNLLPLSGSEPSVNQEGDSKEEHGESTDDTNALQDASSILVLMSSRNAVRGTMCEQSHFSHILFYKNFDVPLGKFLQDNLLNQRCHCTTCGELPETHIYHYAHHNKQLTLQVKRLEKLLPGEEVGKLWMWSRCSECKFKNENEAPKSTKRVLLSTATHSLSFGKFLELSFSANSSGRSTRCGHSLDKDFLTFFGLGPMAVMFKYSSMTTFTVSLPLQKLEINCSPTNSLAKQEFQDAYSKGMLLFCELEDALKKLRCQFSGYALNLQGSLKRYADIEHLLIQDRSNFELTIQNAMAEMEKTDKPSHTALGLNQVLWDLAVASYVWEHRLGPLIGFDSAIKEEQKQLDATGGAGDEGDDIIEAATGRDDQLDQLSETAACEWSSPPIDDLNGCLWQPLSEIQRTYMKDLRRGLMPVLQVTSDGVDQRLPAACQFIAEEGPRMHVPMGNEGCIVRDYDGEISSVIACALAYLTSCSTLTDSAHVLIKTPALDSEPAGPSSSICSEDLHFSTFDGSNALESLVPRENLSVEISLGVAKSLGKGKYSVVCVYDEQFRGLRARCFPSEPDYIASLSRCKNWEPKGGKSRASFVKTLDGRFILKEIKKTELESFMKFAPHYFKYLNESFELGNQTSLAKVFGIYQVTVRHSKNGKETRHDLMVMENLMFAKSITRQYDLKGALYARFNTPGDDGPGDVLLDQNFVNDMNSSPLYVSSRTKRLLERAVWNDTLFLNSINVMDYSLLVGVDVQRQDLICGIIDYLRQYTWDKQLETWVKTSLVVPKNVLPTVISPKEYKKRFRKFMSANFLCVPDAWCSNTSAVDDENR